MAAPRPILRKVAYILLAPAYPGNSPHTSVAVPRLRQNPGLPSLGCAPTFVAQHFLSHHIQEATGTRFAHELELLSQVLNPRDAGLGHRYGHHLQVITQLSGFSSSEFMYFCHTDPLIAVITEGRNLVDGQHDLAEVGIGFHIAVGLGGSGQRKRAVQHRLDASR